MFWLQSIDLALFRWINQSSTNSVFDLLMPMLSDPKLILLPAIISVPFLLYRGPARLRTCLIFAVLVVILGELLLIAPLKQAIGRPRPADTLPETRLLAGSGKPRAMPSGHAANAFAVAAVCIWFYRRPALLLLPVVGAIAFSRVYTGAHYPTDVIAGATLGIAWAAVAIWLADHAWAWLGKRFWPLWYQRFPSLKHPVPADKPNSSPAYDEELRKHWLRLSYLIIVVLLLARWAFLAGGGLELSEDEAYQWVWSKHLDLSYYSKPPMIAYAQFLGTTLWGDTEFGVRFFSPLIAATVSFLLLRFFARHAHPKAGFWLLVMATATPLMATGSILMTIDPLSVLFWTAALVAGWSAMTSDRLAPWAWTGLWLGLGFLSKYVALLQWLSFAVFFLLWPPARRQLQRPGPYLALAINVILALPVLIWNARHEWIGFLHVSERGGLDHAWQPTLRYLGEFVGAEFGLLNPVFFVAALWAMVGFWKRLGKSPLPLYLFSMGAPLFLLCLLFTLRSRVHPNWIAPAVIPLFGLTVLYWSDRFQRGATYVKPWLATGFTVGFTLVVLLHETDNVRTLTGRQLPVEFDPLRRVRGWRATAHSVGQARDALRAEGKPTFILASHYGIAGLLSFYMPEARATITTAPIIYCLDADRPKNQFHLWPGYDQRQGQNALFIREGRNKRPIPPRLLEQFNQVTNLPVVEILHRRNVLHQLHIAECRDLR